MRKIIAGLVLGVLLVAGVAAGVARAQVPPMYAGDGHGSAGWFPDYSTQTYYWTMFSFPGYVAAQNGIIFGLDLDTNLQGVPLNNKPQPFEMFVPNILCEARGKLGIIDDACLIPSSHWYLGNTVIYGPLKFGATRVNPNTGDVGMVVMQPGAYQGGSQNPITGLYNNPASCSSTGCIVRGHPHLAVNPYGGIPFIGMPVEVVSYIRSGASGADKGIPISANGVVKTIMQEVRLNFYVGELFQKVPTWFKGNWPLIGGMFPSMTDFNRGAIVLVPTKDANGVDCPSKLGEIEQVNAAADTAWVQNELIDTFPTLKKVVTTAFFVVGGGNCKAVSSVPIMNAGGTSPLNPTQAAAFLQATNGAAASNNQTSSLYPDGTPKPWMDVISDYDDNIVGVGYGTGVVVVKYLCPTGTTCPTAEAIRAGIGMSVDVNNPSGGTVAQHLLQTGVTNLEVEIVDDDNNTVGMPQSDSF